MLSLECEGCLLAPHDGRHGQPEGCPAGCWARASQRPRRLPSRAPWPIPLLLPACRIDRQGPFPERRPLQPGQRRLGLCSVRHLDKAKAPGAAGGPMRDDPDLRDDAIGVKEHRQLFLCGRKGQIPDKNMGFDHGVGHPLLLLCHAKAPNYWKNKAFNDLACYAEWPKVADAVIKAKICMDISLMVGYASPSQPSQTALAPRVGA